MMVATDQCMCSGERGHKAFSYLLGGTWKDNETSDEKARPTGPS